MSPQLKWNLCNVAQELALAAGLGTLYSLWTIYGAGVEATGWGAVLLASGIPVYLAMRLSRRGSSPAPGAAPAAPPG